MVNGLIRSLQQELGFLLTAVGHSEAVGHLQVVNVRREAELCRPELDHPDPERTVLLVRSARKQAP